MASMGIDGLVSGLDTTSLINQLMSVEAIPQQLLQNKQSSANSLVTALQALNAKVSSLADAAAKAAKPASWDAFAATSTNTNITASIADGATVQPSSLTFRTDAVAQSQVSVSGPQTLDKPFGYPLVNLPATINIASSTGATSITIAANASISDVAAAVNAASAGVTATVVRAGTDGNGDPLYRLQLTGTETGEDASFTAEITDGTNTVALAGTLGTDVRQATDAEITVYPGNPQFAQTIKSATNIFSNLLSGVDVTVTAGAEGQDTTVSVGRDDAALRKLGSDLVGQLGLVFGEISSQTAIKSDASQDLYGVTVKGTSGGIFSGDSAVRGLQQSLMEAASRPVNWTDANNTVQQLSPSVIGINLDKSGNFTFDQAKFDQALAADPAKVQTVLTGIAERVAQVASTASDKYSGTLTLKVQSQQSLIKDLDDQIANWDLRLASRREGLQRTYSALEVALSNMQSQSTWLAGQLSGLMGNSNN
jgi:flagellar hook-associated protein 2